MRRQHKWRLFSFTLVFLLVLFRILIIFPYPFLFLFNTFFGKSVIHKTLNFVINETTDPDMAALSVLSWEKRHFYSPYSSEGSEILFFHRNKNRRYFPFFRNAPISWIIFSGLANCGEYSRVFVYLLNVSGIHARYVHVRGEDHAWAEYYSDHFKIVVDPSTGRVISDTKKFAEGKNWSYIESVALENSSWGFLDYSTSIDVSDEYIERGVLFIRVYRNNLPLRGAYVSVFSPYLMRIAPERYSSPRLVLKNVTNEEGIVVFRLGGKEYFIQIMSKNPFLGYNRCNLSATVIPHKTTNINVTFDRLSCNFSVSIV